MEWLTIIIPIIFIVFLLFFFLKRVQWWEPLLFIPCFLIIITFKSCSEHTQTKDYEYWNGYVTEVWYFEDWSEWITKTCSRDYACGTDDDGNTIYCTEYYDCSYEKYHPEYYQIRNNIGQRFYINRSEYIKYVKLFGNSEFVNMYRNYCCGNDGDAYATYYLGEPEKIEHTTTKHVYENRVKASNSVFKFRDISTSEADSLGLFNYPNIKNRYQRHLLGMSDSNLEKKLEYLNGMLGHKKELNVYLLIFDNKPINYAELQTSYWMGGNKNEFNIMISLDENGYIKWADVMTWSESFETKIRVRNYIMEHRGDIMNFDKFIDYLYDELENNFKRKRFSDFNYLKIGVTKTHMMWLYITMIIICMGLSAFIIFNNFDND